MGKTKKVAQAAKFGTRYGMRLRKRWLEIDKKQRAPHPCPQCKTPSLKRVSTAIWECKKCGTKLAGGAYVPTTGIVEMLEESKKGKKEK